MNAQPSPTRVALTEAVRVLNKIQDIPSARRLLFDLVFTATPADRVGIFIDDGSDLFGGRIVTETTATVTLKASFAQDDPPLLKRLADARVDYLIDPQALRFASASFLDVARIGGLPYAPRGAISPASSDADLEALVRGASTSSIPMARPRSSPPLRRYTMLDSIAGSTCTAGC